MQKAKGEDRCSITHVVQEEGVCPSTIACVRSRRGWGLVERCFCIAPCRLIGDERIHVEAVVRVDCCLGEVDVMKAWMCCCSRATQRNLVSSSLANLCLDVAWAFVLDGNGEGCSLFAHPMWKNNDLRMQNGRCAWT